MRGEELQGLFPDGILELVSLSHTGVARSCLCAHGTRSLQIR